MKSSIIQRRQFLQTTLSALTFLPFCSFKDGFADLSKKYRVGLIGAGWYGKSDLFRMMQVVPTEVVAICDVNKKTLQEAAKLVKERGNSYEPKQYSDYRKMLSEQKFDVVIIGTPDHWHALMAIEALKSDAHIYLQKPISVDVLEGEAIVNSVKNTHKKVQVGLQRRNTPHVLQAKKEVIDSGMLGNISHVEMCCYYHMRDQRKIDPIAVPEYLDWDMYCGPAPLKSYDGIGWRSFMEFGNGIMGDMCVHMYDTARWLLNLGWPKKISSSGGILVQKSASANIADTQTAVFEHENLDCVWTHRTWGTAPDPEYPWALFIYGEHGTLKVSTMKCDFIPTDKAKKSIRYDVVYERIEFPSDLTEPRIELHAAPATRAHFKNLINSIEQDLTPSASLMESHISTASCILANNSMELGRGLVYDPVKKIVLNDEEATLKLMRKYREPWIHPYEKLRK
jgi:predicted dehydrogenase